MEGAIPFAIVGYGAEDVAGTHLLPLGNNGTRQVAIDGNVAAVTNQNVASACKLEDAGNNPVEDSTSAGSGTANIVRALVVELHTLHTRHIIQPEAATHHILSRDGHWQPALVLFEGAVELAVFCREPSARFAAAPLCST